jgi:hypothetical protein
MASSPALIWLQKRHKLFGQIVATIKKKEISRGNKERVIPRDLIFDSLLLPVDENCHVLFLAALFFCHLSGSEFSFTFCHD